MNQQLRPQVIFNLIGPEAHLFNFTSSKVKKRESGTFGTPCRTYILLYKSIRYYKAVVISSDEIFSSLHGKLITEEKTVVVCVLGDNFTLPAMFNLKDKQICRTFYRVMNSTFTKPIRLLCVPYKKRDCFW